jgi:hypothetical protein
MKRKTFLPTLLVIVALMLAITSCTPSKTSSQQAEIPILAWYSIPPGEFQTLERYQELRDCGFTLSFSHIYSEEDARLALDLCAEVGLKSVYMSPGLEDDPEETVHRVMNHPGLGAYFLRDEPGNDALPSLGEWAARITSVDSLHPCYLNLLPRHAFGSTEAYREHLELFNEHVNLPQISYDHYPINQSGDTIYLNPWFFENLELVSAEAARVGKPFWAFALATAHDPYPIPQMSHLRLQLYANLAYGAQCLQYFTYWNPDTETWNFHQAPITQDGQRSPVYELVRAMNRELQIHADVFVGCRVDSVRHTGAEIPLGTTRFVGLPPHFTRFDTGGRPALVSMLTNGNAHYILIQNTSPNHPLRLEAETDGTLQLLHRDGTQQPATLYGPLFILESGDILLFKYN